MLFARGGEVRIHEIHSEKHEARAGAGRARLRVLPGVHLGDAVGRVCAVSDRAGGSGLFHARVFRAKRDPASLACGFRLGRLLLAEGSAVAFSDTGAGAFSCGFAAGCLAAWRRGFVRVVACRGGACFGWGSGIMFGALQEIVAAQKVFTAGIVVFAAAGISALLFFAVEVLPADAVPWMSLFVFVGATVALTCAAWKCAPKVHPMFDTVPDQRRDRCREAVSELWRPLLCVAFSAFIVGIVRVGSASGGGSIGQTNESNMIGLLAASVALLATWRFLYERVTLMRLYQILFPLTATAFLLLPLLEGTFRQVVYSLVFLVFSVTSSLMVVSCARTARNQSLTPVLVYGTFASIVYASSLAGSVVGLFVGAGRGVGLAELSVVALVAVYALSVAMVAPHGRKAGSVKAASGEKLAPVVGAVGDSVTAGCAVAVERYGLSRREAEVLDLLARGRDVPYVAEELVISKNTVRTHTKSIFAKTGVHSRQELIDLVESIEA
nr:helix-turn-helix transcriptional regulator [Eggerthella lenta]